MNKAFVISAVLAAAVSGSISFLASLTIIIMIFRSNLKLSTIYRRLIFGLSVFDLFQSFSQITGALLMPKGTMWSAIGNDASCSASGFLLSVGVCGAVLYSLSISMYFLCIVKFEMPEKTIRKYVEPFLHGIPIVYSLGMGIYILSIHYFNVSGITCWIGPPNGANEANEADDGADGANEADEGGGGVYGESGKIDETKSNLALIQRWIVAFGPMFFVLLVNCIILGLIWWTVYYENKIMTQVYARASASINPPSEREREHERQHQHQNQNQTRSLFGMAFTRSSNASSSMSPLTARLSRPSRSTTQMLKEISNRATAYIVGYVMTYTCAIISKFIQLYTTKDYPFVVTMFSRVLLPLQGFFNLLTYTYPHVMTYRRRHNGTSWIRAFWEVVKSGGDSDQKQPKRRKMPRRITNRNGNRRSKYTKQRRDILRNEPVISDIDESLVSSVKRVRESHMDHSSREMDSENQPVQVESEDIDDDDDVGTQPTVLDYGQSFVRDFNNHQREDSANELDQEVMENIIHEGDNNAVKDVHGVQPGCFELRV